MRNMTGKSASINTEYIFTPQEGVKIFILTGVFVRKIFLRKRCQNIYKPGGK